MKIVFLTNGNHPGTLGGIQTFNRNLKKIFQNDLITLTLKNKNRKFYKINDVIEVGGEGIFYRIVNKLSKRMLIKFLIRRKIRKIKPDVCILSSPIEIDILKNIKCRKILVQHTGYLSYLDSYFNNDKDLIERSKKELDYFVFLSKYDLKKFNEELNFPIEKSIVIRHTVDLELFCGIKEKNKKLIMIGRIYNEDKRYDLAISAMKKLKEFTLLIYGDGPDLKYLKDLVSKEKINNVIFKGPTNNIVKALDEASIFIMTSDYEGYGITNIEAMRRGLPIILRNTFEAAEDIVVDNKNGILLGKEWNEDKFVKAVQEIYDNYNYYHKNAMLERKKYDYTIIKAKWEQVLKI